jgi:hypothetical protein
VELLVATAVLVLMIAMVGQLFNSATSVTTGSRKQLEADNQARMVFDRMALDFAKMVKRRDVDSIMCKSGTGADVQNDSLFFFSEAPAYTGPGIKDNKSSVALIGYRINQNSQLERLGNTLGWDGTLQGSEDDAPGGIVFLSGSSVSGPTVIYGEQGRIADTWKTTIGKFDSNPPFVSGSSKDYHVLAESVYRMEVCFLVKDFNLEDANAGTKAVYSNFPMAVFHTNSAASTDSTMRAHSQALESAPTSSVATGDRWFDTTKFRCYTYSNGSWQPNGMDDVLGIVVTIAMLDESSRQIVLDPTTRGIKSDVAAKMIQAFPEPIETDLNPISSSTRPKLVAQKWQEALFDPGFKDNSGLPRIAASQVRVYQRFFSLKTK